MRAAVFHWTFERVGGAEILANYLAKALNCKVYCFGKSKLGFEDLTPYVSRPLRALKQVHSLEYLLWSLLDVEEIGDFDVVVTSGATPRALITPEHTIHVSYLHSPPRWLYDLWHFRRRMVKNPLKRFIIDLLGEALRIWDQAIDSRVDYYFANSEIIQRRLWKYLKRDSVVLYPPIEWNRYKCEESEDYILFLSRLEPEKRVEESIRACVKAGKKIVVAGTGSLEKSIREKYENHPLVDIRGFVDEKEKIDLLAHCKAVIFPAVAEDFGIVLVEALASGKPVIVDNSGFPPLLLKKTGFRLSNGVIKVYNGGIVTIAREDMLKIALHHLNEQEWDYNYLREFARSFDFDLFRARLLSQLRVWKSEFDNKLEVS